MNEWLKQACGLWTDGRSSRRAGRWITTRGAALLVNGAAAIALLAAPDAEAQEANACLSTNPADWPAPAKPYFMLAVDTSGSMICCTNPATAGCGAPDDGSCPTSATPNSCGMEPTRMNDAKCALRKTVQAFSGEVNFGLATFATRLSGCSGGACPDSCTTTNGQCDSTWPVASTGDEGEFYSANGCGVTGFLDATVQATCGNQPDCSTTNSPIFGDDWRNGGNVVVDMLQDPLPWAGSPPASNVSTLLSWFDGQCDGSRELYALGRTPIEGILRSAHQYLAAGWASGWRNGNYCSTGGATIDHAAAMDDRDPACRNVNVILLTDGDETCSGTATSAAAALFNTGITRAGKTWRVRTHVINFAGGTQASTDAIADFGDDGIDQTPNSANSYFANNEATLAQALSSIIAGAIRPEVCNNLDDNCNGCSDEGYRKFCNRGKTPVADPTAAGQCCSAARDVCLGRYNASLATNPPNGDLFELPCWNPATDPTLPQTKWLCVDPAEICDDADNNCNATCTGAPPNVVCGFQNLASPPNTIDESFNKCGTPLACPTAEVCDGRDNNCDNIIDNAAGSGVPFSLPGCTPCVPTAEVCDGCDNDCDGTADNGTFTQTCGFTPPANCAGNQSCLAPVAVPRGTCLPGFPRSRYGTCTNNPQTEICDGIDNNCNGAIDEGIPPTACDIPGTPPPTIVYKTTFPPSQCVRGTIPCGGTCSGWVGPSSEICDGIDNDCNGVVDDNVPGVGNPCGSAAGQCRKGNTACVGGQLVCQGGQQPQPEVCNGLDDDCDGTPDDAPLGDAPANSACWNRPPTGCSPVCSHQNLQWCPPPSATCTTRGTLTTPCATGNLVCDGVNRWKCVGGQEPGIEVCDGIDNNCNGQIDEGITGPPVGLPCGPSEGECEPGRNVCRAGRIECDGGIGPTPEICDGKDNDCDTVIDDGIDVGGPCTAPYDTTLYPGDRTKGECKPGTLVCNQGCVGGTGPVPEVCDGKDNDCDGNVDESGPQPDGIDGTVDPNDSSRRLGDPCGVNVGECRQGRLGCQQGRVVCAGAIGQQPEQCDCKDNDCNGQVDDQVDGGSPLCGGDQRCAQVAAGVCQCAGPCRGGEFPCPLGLSCTSVPISGSTERAELCVNDPCGNCATKTVNNPTTNQPECGPSGGLPLCVCQGTAGCRNPCFNVQCGDEQRCATQGPAAGTCQPDSNCNFFGCQPGNACHNGSCVPNPCSPNPCGASEVCKPNADFTAHRCEGTCANVTCPAGQECKGGTCTPNGCGQACPPGQFCFPPLPSDAGAEAGTDAGAEASTDAGVGTCGPTRCSTDSGLPCADGRFCNPITGGCEDDPCSGVVCPTAQICRSGECDWAPETGGGTGGAGGMAGTGGAGGGSGDASAGTSGRSSGGTASGGTAGSGERPRGTWGLATGGGGCACRAGGEQRRLASSGALLMLLGVAMTALRRKRRRRPGGARVAGGAQ